jgi:hypothetical protein
MTRAELHALVDTLPDGALENTRRFLQQLQKWPSQPSPEIGRMREIGQEQMGRMSRSILPGTVGGGGGGGSFNARTGYGHSGHTHWEDDTVVHQAHHFFKGHEIVVSERLRFTDEGKAIHYAHEAKGPKGEPILNETTFDLA